MGPRKIISSFFLVALLIGLDWASKAYVRDLTSSLKLGPITITKVFNPGLMMGIFASIPGEAKIAIQAATALLLLGGYVLFEMLLKFRSMKLQIGILFLLGGIFGNTLDRFFFGAVTDFLVISFPPFSRYALNFADISQIFGLGFIVVAFFTDFREYWVKKELRNSLVINPDLQHRQASVFALISFISSSMGLAIGMAFIYSYVDSMTFGLFCSLGGVFSIILALLAYGTGLILSHRIAGPLYAIKRFLRSTLEGKQSSLSLRRTDELRVLEDELNEINRRLSTSPPEDE